MGKGNVAKAAQKRERNAAKDAAAGKKIDQKGAAQAALTYVCDICRQGFMCTMNQAQLQQHVDNKHESKTFDECFPNYDPEAKKKLKQANQEAAKKK